MQVTQAALFNPYDRALYLSVKNKRRFLCSKNFQSPYQGFFQSIAARAFSGGLYFPLEHFFRSLVSPDAPSSFNFVAGSAAGAANALFLNPASAVKYKTWGRDTNRGVVNEAIGMYAKGGFRPFCNGMLPTLLRDTIFGGCYTFLRLQVQRQGLSPEHQWVANIFSAVVATVASAPFNFARNVQYATKSEKETKGILPILSKLATNVAEQPDYYSQWSVLQNRLRIGWGTARVAIGMAFAHHIYDLFMINLEPIT